MPDQLKEPLVHNRDGLPQEQLIFSVRDSPYSADMELLFIEQASREWFFRLFLYMNSVAFVTVFLALSGLSVATAINAIVSLYFVLAATIAFELRTGFSKPSTSAPKIGSLRSIRWTYIIHDLVLASILWFNATAVDAAPVLTTVGAVVAASFVTLIVTPKSIIEFFIGKTFLLFTCLVYIALSNTAPGSDAGQHSVEHGALSLFPLVLVFILMFAAGYWIYLEHIRQMHQRLLQRSLHQQIEKEKNLRERLFVYIGHDLRQPINALGMLLHSTPVEPQNIIDSQQCVRSCKRLINDIVQIADYQVDQLPCIASNVSVQSIFDEISFEYTFEASLAACTLRIVPTSIVVCNDHKLLTRIIKNFVSNAIVHAPNSDILMGVRRRKNHIDILVLDNGPGISRQDHERIFKEFTRGNSRMGEHGLGLGLAIASHFATVCAAEILFTSELKAGTCIGLRLPR